MTVIDLSDLFSAPRHAAGLRGRISSDGPHEVPTPW